MLCSICYKSRSCEETFREVALSLRYDYILEEYSSLSDAWRVYQGVALYREYRGIGGVTTQLDVTPTPCHMCLVKIVKMAQSIYLVTTSIQPGPLTSKCCDESDTETEIFNRNIKSTNNIVSEESDDSHLRPSQDISSKLSLPNNIRQAGRAFVDRDPQVQEEEEKDPESKDEEAPSPSIRDRPRRSAGRSLFERHPDFALESQFARILRQRGLREGKQRKMREAEVQQGNGVRESSLKDSSGQEEEEEDKDWRHSTSRSSHLSRLDKALSTAGWMPAIKNGRSLEAEVFKTSSSESEYLSGINKLIDHFSRGSQSAGGKFAALLKPGSGKRTVKPTRKILDGLDFRRKPRKKIKTPKPKLGEEMEHSKKSDNEEKQLMGEPKSPETSDVKDNVSICDSELSISSHGTNDSYERSQNSRPRRRKRVTATVDSSIVPEPSACHVKGEIKSESDVIYEASVSQKIVDEFLCSDSDTEEVSRPRRGLDAYYINNYNLGDKKYQAVQMERPQRRKRSLEERHPDFVLDLPSKKGVKCPGPGLAEPNILSSSENNEI